MNAPEIRPANPVLMESVVSALGSVKVVQESKDSPASFADSTEATEFVDRLAAMLKSPALEKWANATDKNFGAKSWKILDDLIDGIDAFVDELDSAS